MTEICILGAGRVAAALAAQMAKSGTSFTIGARDIERSRSKWSGPYAAFIGPAAAIVKSSIVFNATPGETSVAFLGDLKRQLEGKILIDVSNALKRNEKGMPAGLLYPDSSVAEHLQNALPGTFVVKTLNTMLFSVIADPSILAAMPVAFMSGNDATVKTRVRALLNGFGWVDELIEDLGGIATARGPEAFMHFVPSIIAKHGFAPFALTLAR